MQPVLTKSVINRTTGCATGLCGTGRAACPNAWSMSCSTTPAAVAEVTPKLVPQATTGAPTASQAAVTVVMPALTSSQSRRQPTREAEGQAASVPLPLQQLPHMGGSSSAVSCLTQRKTIATCRSNARNRHSRSDLSSRTHKSGHVMNSTTTFLVANNHASCVSQLSQCCMAL